ncbi:hypothetical protein M9Y10_023919 [Tritrichomonas musculus]|uniref:Protein kinase domain-containing protein n=1 Tax=Tritrichomonas musculus TaxID=1915356 RepID=A0ABR2KWH9_9EUKA
MNDEEIQDPESILYLFREANLMVMLNHPSVLKFIGYSQYDFNNDLLPTIVSEFATSGSLRDIINLEISGLAPDDWNLTKKLIN